MKYKLNVIVPITIATWLGVTCIYGYLWVNHVLETEILYGYERSRLLISSAFVIDKGPYLLIALVVIIGLELLVALYLQLKS